MKKNQPLPKPKLKSPWPEQKKRINRAAIEWDLKTYPAMKREIEEVLQTMDDIAAPSAVDVRSSVYSIPHKSSFKPRQLGDQPEYIVSHPVRHDSDPTANKAEQLRQYRETVLHGTEYRETVRRVNAIEWTMERLEKSKSIMFNQQALLVKRAYFDQEDVKEVVKELNISLRTFYYWRDSVINKIAKELGFII